MKESRGARNEEITAQAKSHNAALSNVLKKLETELEGFRYAEPDCYTSVSDRMNHPYEYGNPYCHIIKINDNV